MAHLNCLPPRAAGVNFWFFIAIPSGGGCWHKAKCKMRDATTQDKRWNEHAKFWIFSEIAKWRLWRHAPRLTATAVVTDSRCRFFKRRHVADIKHRRQWPGNTNGRLKFRKYRVYLQILRVFRPIRSQLLFCGWRQRQLLWTRAVVFRRDDTLPT